MLSSPLDYGCLWRHIFFFLVLAMFPCERQQKPLKCDLRGQILVLVTNYLYHLEQATLYLWCSLFRARMKRSDGQRGHPRPLALGRTCVRRHWEQTSATFKGHPEVWTPALTLQSAQGQRAGRLRGMSKSQGYGKPWREAIEVVQSPASSGGLLASYQGEKKRTSHTVCTQTTKWPAWQEGITALGQNPGCSSFPAFVLLSLVSQAFLAMETGD